MNARAPTMPPDGLWESTLRYGEMRERAMGSPPRCSQCDAVQVQVMDWSVEPMEWRCRVCGHRFHSAASLA